MSLRTVLGSRAPLLSEGPEVASGIELDSFFLFPDAFEQFQPVRLDATFDARAKGSRRPASGSPRTPRPPSAPAPACCSSPTRRPAERRFRRCSRPGSSTTGWSPAGLRTKATLLVETDEAREVHHFACLLGYGAEADLPTARARDACGDGGGRQDRRRPAVARRGAAPLQADDRGRRPQGHVQDGHLRHRELLRRADLRRGRARAGGRRPRVRRHAVPDRRHRLRRARARAPASGSRRRRPRSRHSRTPAT